MKIKMIKQLLSFTVRTAICVMLFAVAAGIKHFLPQVFEPLEEMLTKSVDIKKAGQLIAEVLREVSPF